MFVLDMSFRRYFNTNNIPENKNWLKPKPKLTIQAYRVIRVIHSRLRMAKIISTKYVTHQRTDRNFVRLISVKNDRFDRVLILCFDETAAQKPLIKKKVSF